MLQRLRLATNARLAGVLVLLASLLLLAGCATTPRVTEETRARVAERALLETVPFHAQRDYQCGPASLAMVLQHSGVEVTVETLIPQVFLPGREGSVQPEMLATVRRHGRIPVELDGSLDALIKALNAGHPVVVLQNLSLPAWPLWHYAVAIGYDLERGELLLHSGEQAQRRESLRRFDATWARSERWAFVALPPGELPASVDEATALAAIADFERVQGAEATLPAWQGLAIRFPASAHVHFALGNARHAAGDDAAALAAFATAVEQDPSHAAAWLNLGLLHAARAEAEAARDALSRAAALPGPWQRRAREALARLPVT